MLLVFCPLHRLIGQALPLSTRLGFRLNHTYVRAIHLAPQVGQCASGKRHQTRTWTGVPGHLARVRGLVCQRGSLSCLPGTAEVARWLLLSRLRCRRRSGAGHSRQAHLPILPVPRQLHGRHDLRQDTYSAAGLVRGGVVHHQPEVTCQRARIAAGTWVEQLPDGVGDVASISAGNGSPGA